MPCTLGRVHPQPPRDWAVGPKLDLILTLLHTHGFWNICLSALKIHLCNGNSGVEAAVFLRAVLHTVEAFSLAAGIRGAQPRSQRAISPHRQPALAAFPRVPSVLADIPHRLRGPPVVSHPVADFHDAPPHLLNYPNFSSFQTAPVLSLGFPMRQVSDQLSCAWVDVLYSAV